MGKRVLSVFLSVWIVISGISFESIATAASESNTFQAYIDHESVNGHRVLGVLLNGNPQWTDSNAGKTYHGEKVTVYADKAAVIDKKGSYLDGSNISWVVPSGEQGGYGSGYVLSYYLTREWPYLENGQSADIYITTINAPYANGATVYSSPVGGSKYKVDSVQIGESVRVYPEKSVVLNSINGNKSSGKSYAWVEMTGGKSGYLDMQWLEQKPTVRQEEESSISSYVIYCDANGGTINGETGYLFLIEKNETYQKIPSAIRSGYIFDGWYTAEIDGERIDSTSTPTSDQILYAHWSTPKTYTVSFHSNGGSVSPTNKSVINGFEYGSLPIPTQRGYQFLGWYTDIVGGTKIIESTIANLSDDQVLYAHWKKNEVSKVSMLSYSFENSRNGFGYSNNYKIPYERYQFVFGDNTYAKAIYNRASVWGGSCFGMATSAGLFANTGNDVSAVAFKNTANVPYDLSPSDKNSEWDLTLTQFIEAMHIAQYDSLIQNGRTNNKNDLNELCQLAINYQNTGKNPPVIDIFHQISNSEMGGHSLLGYEIINISNSESRLMVYDPNFPNEERYITLTKNNSGEYTGWHYYLNNREHWGSNYGNFWITYAPCSAYSSVWEEMSNGITSKQVLVNTNISNATITSSDGTIIAKIVDGEVKANRTDIYPLAITDAPNQTNDEISLWMPAGEYLITNEDTLHSNAEITMLHLNQSAAVSTNAPTIALFVDDNTKANYVSVKGNGSEYDIELESTLPNQYGKVRLTGTISGGQTSFAQVSGELYGCNTKNAILCVDGVVTPKETLSDQMPDIFTSNGVMNFKDVPNNSYYYKAVKWAAEKGITGGIGNGLFGPNQPCTRAQIVTFLWRAAGSPEPKAMSSFADVSTEAYYAKAVAWAVENGITTGTGDGKFSPDATCTRAQSVTFLFRAIGKLVDSKAEFSDVLTDSYYANAVAWAVENGVTNGIGDGLFGPNNSCTRAQIVTFLYRTYMVN